MKRLFGWTIGTILALFFLACAGLTFPIETAFVVAFGWIAYLMRVVPEVEVSPSGVLTAVVALSAFVFGVHRFASWLFAALAVPRDEATDLAGEYAPLPPAWQLRWTLQATSILLVMFVAGIAMVGVSHQIAWLASSPEPLVGRSGDIVGRNASINYLKQIGLGLDNHHNARRALPAGGTADPQGRMLHGWQTMILPFIEQGELYEKIDLSQPWDAPANAPHFRQVLPEYLNPSIGKFKAAQNTDSAGWGLSHYAGNSRVLGGTRPRKYSEFADGQRQTIVAGEAHGNFKPWGHPGNWRDPDLGLNSSPDGFGGHHGGGVTAFVFADGHVATLSGDIDPGVLHALSTPNGGETIDADAEY